MSDSTPDHDSAYNAVESGLSEASPLDTRNYIVGATAYAEGKMERDREAEGRKMDDNKVRDLFLHRCFHRSGVQMMRLLHSSLGKFQ